MIEPNYAKAFIEGLTPDPDMTVSEWADQHRMLSQKASAEPGRWRTSRTPYLRDIMDALSPSSPIQTVVFQAGAQIGKSECGANWMAYIIDAAPGPLMAVQPTVDMAKRFSKQRVAPMIEETPRLRDRVADSRSRDSGNTQLVKEFAGGFMLLTGANSAVSLRSTPIRYLFLDEVDGYPVDVDGEGDPVNLAVRRTTTFARRKILMTSTPTEKETSRIEREYLASDQRRFFVPCPHCGEYQHLEWGGPRLLHGIKWTDNNPATAHYVCKHHGCVIEEFSKTDMLAAGEWRATATSDGKTAGFHINSLYSPLGWKSWSEIVDEFIKAKRDPSLLKTWVNTVLGEAWESETAAKLSASDLMQRIEYYPKMLAPDGVLAITAGVDTQNNRLAVTIIGWGRGEEAWVLGHQEIFGDPARPELWKQLEDVIMTLIPHETAGPMPIMATCIDSGGHFTHEVYEFSRKMKRYSVYAIKGQSQAGKPVIGRPTKVDLHRGGKVYKKGAEVWPVGSDTAKSTIYARLKIVEAGTGFIHFPELEEEYFAQLTAERKVTKYLKGFPVSTWEKKPGQRNEALDTFVYAFAAMQSIYFRYNRNTVWDQLEKKLPEKPVVVQDVKPAPVVDAEPEPEVKAPEPPSNPPPRADSSLKKPLRRRTRSAGSNFVTGW